MPIADHVPAMRLTPRSFRSPWGSTRCARSALLLLTLAGEAMWLMGTAPATAIQAAAGRGTLRVLDLTAVRRSLLAMARKRPRLGEGERVAAWSDFSLMLQAVVGEAPVGPFTFDDFARDLRGGAGPSVPVTAGVIARDRVAYQMLSVGYSARETADVVSGRITRRALDRAWGMIAAGQGRDAAADYLDSQYVRVRPLAAPASGSRRAADGRRRPFEAAIDRYATLHAVNADLVRAIIAAESAFDPVARSDAGAIGLMQLMPMTARELGVDPFVPEQNIEGGVRYFSQLLKTFGGVETALVAYNAGPGFAARYARGETALYGETRAYVRAVLRRFEQES